MSFHGGPEGHERPDWSPVAQSLVAAGFTVFAPNVRGSGGFGRAFLTADDGPAREASFDDVRTTVDELVTAGIAEPGPDRRARLVLRRLPHAGGADPLAGPVRRRGHPARG